MKEGDGMKKIYLICTCAILIGILIDCNFQNSKSENNIDTSEYMKKIWILNSTSKDEKMKNIFFILNDADKNLTGQFFSSNDLKNDDIVIEDSRCIGDFTGKLKDNILQCPLKKQNDVYGTIKMRFIQKDKVEVLVSDLNKKHETRMSTGKFEFVPYKLKDIRIGRQSNKIEKSLWLKKWGSINFVTWVFTTSKKHSNILMYLSDKDGNVLYKFNKKYGFPESYFVKEFSFQDLNDDENEELILILGSMDTSNKEAGDGPYVALIFLQLDNGVFEWMEKIDKKLNNSDGEMHNESVKQVTEYIKLIC